MALLAPSVLVSALLAAAPGPAAPIRLQALTATSGSGAEALLDGDPKTGWRPAGDPAGEGVLLRFEEPVRADAIEILSCGGEWRAEPYVNGGSAGGADGTWDPAGPAAIQLRGRAPKVQSLFVKIAPGAKAPCVGEVVFDRGREQVRVLPPRQVPGTVEATSTLAPAAAYHPSYLFDARLDFGWVEGAKGNGEGEAVTVTLDAPLELAAIEVWNGYQRSPVHFQKNARARKIALSLDGGPPIPLELKDVQGAQRLALPAPVRASRIRLEIVSAYPGSKYQDLVLSELRFRDAEGPVGVAVKDREKMRAALAAEVKGSVLAALLGKQLWNGCDQGDVGVLYRSLKLRADYTFVEYENACDPVGSGCVVEVLDGTWVPVARSGAWSEIEIFARRHRIDSWYDPYAENPARAKETDRIAGGRLKIAFAREIPEPLRAQALDPGSFPAAAGCASNRPEAARDGVIVTGPPLVELFLPDAR